VPKKKTSRRGASPRPSAPRSPLRTGGRALGDLQVPFRRFLEADVDETDGDWMTPGDVEARLMESLGWLLLAQGEDVVPSSATHFAPAELDDLFEVVLPDVAEANDLDVTELREEVATAWMSYLEFLGESGSWLGADEELADCLDVVAADVDGAGQSVLDELAAAVAGVTLEEELAALRAVPAAAAADPAPESTPEEERAAARARLVGWIVEQVAGPEDGGGGTVGGLAVLVAAVLQRPLTTEQLGPVVATDRGGSLDAALELVGRLVAGGVLAGTEPWTASAGLGPAIAASVRTFLDAGEEEPAPVR
jgi:ribosomal protein L12E/L44/L45/RPP1/RPP2